MRERPMRDQFRRYLSSPTLLRFPSALKSFLQLFLFCATASFLQSCSIFHGASRASLLEIEKVTSTHDPNISFERIPGDTPLYRLIAHNHSTKSSTLFAALLSECRELARPLPTEAALRQLFVGAEQLRIHSKKSFAAPLAAVSMTELSAVVEGAALQFTSFSTRQKNCSFDLVIWGKTPSAEGAQIKLLGDQLAAILQSIAKENS